MTPVVTGLRERKRNRVAVELDGRPWRVLPTDAVVRASLAIGRPLDRNTARELAREIRRARALMQAKRTLATRGRSRRDLEQRLARAGHVGAARDGALETLDRAGLVDDARLAESRAQTLAQRGYGDAAIRADLRRRQIASEAAADAVSSLEPELERARHTLGQQALTPAFLGRLSRRGFSRDTLDELASSFALEA